MAQKGKQDKRFEKGPGSSRNFQNSSRPTAKYTRFEDGAGPSRTFQRSSTPNLKDHESKHKFLDQLKEKYISVYMTKQVINCPDTKCTNVNTILDIVEHLLEVHCDIPRSVIQLDTNYAIPIILEKLEYGRSQCVAVLLVPIVTLRNYDVPTDRSTMPLVVLATKIHPSDVAEISKSNAELASSSFKPENDSDLLMIWICGHVQSMSTIIKLNNLMQDAINVYSGHIHSIAENNHNPNVVLSRGNCLLVAAHSVAGLTNGGKIPLEAEITLTIKEKHLTN